MNARLLASATIFRWFLLPSLAFGAFATSTSTQSCGVNNVPKGKIVNGKDAPEGKWPWLAHLIMESRSDAGVVRLCTGSVVSSRYILTAAHCLLGADRTTATVGSADIYGRGSLHVLAKDVHIHPDFFGVQGAVRNDIALIELSRNLTFSPHVQPICLPAKFSEATPPKQEAVIAGWGKTLKPNAFTTILQEGRVELLPYAKCRRYYRHVVALAPTKHLCAVGRHSDVDHGDSGGPLAVKMSDDEQVERYYQVGITSFGRLTDDVEVPNVYTRLTNYCAWIAQVTRGEVTCS